MYSYAAGAAAKFRLFVTFAANIRPKAMRTIELLAPAKNYEYGCAAVDCGADALYVGAPGFGARVDAAVSVGDIARLCDYAHRFGVRVFVTMNTLVFADELREAERIAR